MNKDKEFYDLVDTYISYYRITEDTATEMAIDELGYKPTYARD